LIAATVYFFTAPRSADADEVRPARLTDDSRYVTGEMLGVTGGRPLA
jgi:hypothetical protein